MPKLTVLVGPPASGKSTLAKDRIENDGDHGAATVYVNGDSQGKDGHVKIFQDAIALGKDIICDRMNFNKEQRNRYLSVAKAKGYETEIIVLHESYKTCLERGRARFGQHETIHEEKHIRGALQTFFGKYERPTPHEADKIQFFYPEGEKPKCAVIDLDGTLANCEHRRHFVRPPANYLVGPDGQMISVLGELDAVDVHTPLPVFKKDWKSFNANIPNDSVNQWCLTLMRCMEDKYKIVLCTGRDSNQQRNTVEWLRKHEIRYDDLFMRDRSDSRQDCVIKEVILDFEILTRYTPIMFIDDRQQVVDMWRKRGFVCLQCDVGDF